MSMSASPGSAQDASDSAPAALAEPAVPPANRWIVAARWAAIAAMAALPFSPPAANVAMGLLLVCFFASGQVRVRMAMAARHPILWGAVTVLAVVAVGMLWAEVPWRARLDAWWSWRKLLLIPVLLAVFDTTAGKRQWAAAFIGVCVGGALWVLAGGLGWLPGVSFEDAGGLLRNRGTQGMSFALATVLALWLAGDRAVPATVRAAALAAMMPMLLALLWVTPGRSGHLALLVGVAVYALGHVRRPRDLALGAVAGLIGLALLAAVPMVQQRFAVAVQEYRDAGQSKEITSFGIRAVMYGHALEVIAQRPFTGVGTGGFEAAYAKTIAGRYPDGDWRATITADPHNQYLFFLAELGPLGLAAFFAYLILALRDPGDGSRARWVARAALLAWCATSLFSSHFKTFAEGHLLSITLGVMLAGVVPGGRRGAAR